jgi:beta-lactamase class C
VKLRAITVVMTVLFAACLRPVHADQIQRERVGSVVAAAIKPVMKKYRIPGMAVGLTVAGRTYVFDYGVASMEIRKPVTAGTLFEIGSVSKTLTATLTSYAQVTGKLSLSDKTGEYIPSLRGSSFGNVPLLDLATHTPGGLPLQVPDAVRSNDELLTYLRHWRPAYAPGTYRTYSNVSIGMLGLIAAKSMSQNFDVLMEERIFSTLGMKHTYLNVPPDETIDYAQGYTRGGAPVRMTAGVLSSEAYGIRSTADDMIRFLEANMQMIQMDAKLQRAIIDTHTGYFKAGDMTQDLIWEQYPYPVSLDTLLQGNGAAMLFDSMPVCRITPPEAPRDDVWINKTGSTNGFGTYVAFVPKERIGIAILANRSYPIADRVTIAYRIVTRLQAAPFR